ncbi:hypothetical protein CI109_104505 [Kwoniella shandongensis]|uniref:Uncharacterized protein n=1 Tax=Kwoniella shandongensis TaxID=1734106 RepID=A0AAJ8LLM7_9TREE
MTSRLRMPGLRTQQSEDSGSPILPTHVPAAPSSSRCESPENLGTRNDSPASGAPKLAPPIGSASSPGAAATLQDDQPADPASPIVDTAQRQRRRRTTILPPVTASALGDLQVSHPSPPVQQGRRRAHTVSVSLRSANRPKFDTVEEGRPLTGGTTRRISDIEEGGDLGRVRTASTSRRRRSGTVDSVSERAGTPVQFDLPERNKQGNAELQDDMVGVLDCIDPHVSTVNHLQNMTNSVLIPHFPQLWSRRPEVQLPETLSEESLIPKSARDDMDNPPSSRRRSATTRSRAGTISRYLPDFMSGREPSPVSGVPSTAMIEPPPSSSWGRTQPIPIPEEPVSYDDTKKGRTQEPSSYDSPIPPLGSAAQIEEQEMEDDIADIKEDHELDRHVKHMLRQNRKAKVKRALQGLWTFVKTPMGFITAVYGFLVAFWGAAIVLFLLGWIPTSSKYRQDVWVEISSQVENGLFTVTGVGLIPWRALDTYRMSVIWTLKSRSVRRRKQRGLPPIEDENDLPDPALIKDYVHVLTDEEQARLTHQQEKFAQSQTWYRPHANATHRAFPMKWALWNTILMDLNSFFQCGCMWGMDWHERPAWTTGCLIPLSFLCGIGAAVLIWQGSVRTKKNVEVSKKLREALSVPLAIGVPRTQDNTVLLSNNNSAPATDIPLHKTESPKKGAKYTAGEGRRATVTFGDVTDHMGFDGDGKRGEGEKGRDRARTVATPEVGGGGGGPERLSMDTRESTELSLEEKEAIAMREVKST